MNWIKRNIWEIERSSALTWLGALIGISQIVTFYYWIGNKALFGAGFVQPLLCWSFLPQCNQGLGITGQFLTGLYTLGLILSAGSLVFFVMQRFVAGAWTMSMISWLILCFIYFLDASLASNTYTLFILVSFGFLFIPSKSKLIRYLILAYFLADSYTRLDASWLSGLPLLGSLAAPEKGLEWVAAFSVLIQMVMPFFAISRDGQRMGYGVGSLIFYNFFYFFVLEQPGYVVVALLLSFYIFDHFEKRRLERETLYQSYEHPEPTNIWWPAVVGLFILAQLPLNIHLPGLNVLQMRAATVSRECQMVALAHYNDKVQWLGQDVVGSLPPGLKCEPQINFNAMKKYCAQRVTDPNFQNMTLFFLSRGLTEDEFRTDFSSDRFCDSSFQARGLGGLSR